MSPRSPTASLSRFAELSTAAVNDACKAALSDATALLDETAWVELKQDIRATSPSANLELARDLASLSVDGGLLIVGVEDKKGKAGDVVGASMLGLADRITATAYSRVDPGLPIHTHELPNPDDPSRGVLIVAVPASESAPHMVDERYWGRSDEGKRRLTDSEVARLFHLRGQHSENLAAELIALSSDEFDPIQPEDDRRHGHLYLLFKPAAHPLGADLAARFEQANIAAIAREVIGYQPSMAPSLGSLDGSCGHPKGRQFNGRLMGNAGVDNEKYMIRLEVHDVGVVQLLSGAATQTERVHFDSDEPRELVNHILEATHSTVMLVGHIASRYMGYWGPWHIGVRITGLRGLEPSAASWPSWDGGGNIYPAREYLRFVHRSAGDLTESPVEVMTDLLKPLLRGLGIKIESPYRPDEIAIFPAR